MSRMISQILQLMTPANSVVGMSVLTMPFCFKQCGIVLAVLLLILCNIFSRLACHFLIKSAVISQRYNFALLASRAFGRTGKFLTEFLIIGFMLSTCVVYFVVVGDLGSQMINKMMDKAPEKIRTGLLIITGGFICLFHGFYNFIFRNNIDNLFSIYTVTITVSYLCLVFKIVSESTLHIFAEDWYNSVNYWRPDGVPQCLPIFFMAFFCQTQLFEIYEAISCLKKMNKIVRGALNICTLVYMCVGLFGYIAFCTQSFTGNILLSFEPGIIPELIKLGFVFSIAFSFPLVIFPCCARLHSLLFRQRFIHELSNVSKCRSQCLIEVIVSISMIISILMPNIEFVLGIVGSTIGVMICLIFPAVIFISIRNRNTIERLLAQCIVVMGISIMVFSTHASLYPVKESTNATSTITNNLLDKVNPSLNIIKNLLIIPDDSNNLEHIPRANDKINKQKINKVVSIVKDVKPILPKPKLKPVIVAKKQRVVKSDKAGILVPKKIKINEEKERFVDLQKNDNLINLGAIKKEKSKLVADRDVERIKKKLKKHKFEIRQKIQKQREFLLPFLDTLRNIKKRKQKFKMKKQRISKNEVFKKSEKKIKKSKRVKSSKKKLDSLQEISPNKDTEALQKKPENVLDDFYFNEEVDNDRKITEKSQDKNNNMTTESSKKKIGLQEISLNKDIEALQKKTGNVPGDFYFIKEDIDREILEKLLHKKRRDETKV